MAFFVVSSAAFSSENTSTNLSATEFRGALDVAADFFSKWKEVSREFSGF